MSTSSLPVQINYNETRTVNMKISSANMSNPKAMKRIGGTFFNTNMNGFDTPSTISFYEPPTNSIGSPVFNELKYGITVFMGMNEFHLMVNFWDNTRLDTIINIDVLPSTNWNEEFQIDLL
jgi:hypothetical protein